MGTRGARNSLSDVHIQQTPTKAGFVRAVSRFAILFGIIVFLVAWPGFTSRAGAQSPPAPAVESSPEHFESTTAPVETSSEAMVADAAEYARMFNVPLSEALRRLEAQEASVPLIDRLADGYRDRLAGIVIEHRPTFQIVIVVTGEAAPDTQVSLAPFGVPIILRSGALATRAAILAAIEAHQADLRAALPSPPGMGVDPQSGRLLVVARSGALDGDDDRTATSERLGAIAGVPVEVRTWGDFDTDLSVEGGGRLVGRQAPETRQFLCTAGFVVTDGTQTALSTAAHCPDQLSFIAPDGTQTPLTMIGAWGARYQDVQIHSAGLSLAPVFHADTAARTRPLITWRNRSSMRAGDFVCHRGERTGYSCALVQLVDYAPPGDLCAGPCPATWVAVTGPKCGGGDSGGPVFLGTVAFGLVKGDSATNGICRLYYYMSTDYLPEGWSLLHAALAAARASVDGRAVPGTGTAR
ncbi:S1 family peptidase [Sphingomonas sp. AP4-R1]|uniref:S1 family peptidase n=1 Tax=Sphingomonas sp. AP4-R1 TaxID=2735134 RepID=UPI001C126CE1|nr:S1 family peptidase [Sphingomonas sp. AP4-R1]